jgi:hypothetical protein
MAGVAGVAATGAIVARDQRQRNAYEADEVRERIHERAQEALLAEEEEALLADEDEALLAAEEREAMLAAEDEDAEP